MPVFQLDLSQIEILTSQPEVGMGLQVANAATAQSYVLVLGSQIALSFDTQTFEQISLIQDRVWMKKTASPEQRERDFLSWVHELPHLKDLHPVEPDRGFILARMMMLMGTGRLTPTPVTPSIHGHLPFLANSESDDVFYRYEPFPVSRRVLQSHGRITSGTYAAPSSETQFVPTGLAAVGRFALPSLFPARWRWEIQPAPGTRLRCGASVPLYGQSGGGVEVMFPSGAANRGPIANPIVLPVL